MRAYRINLRGAIAFDRVFVAPERTDVILDLRAGRALFGMATISDPLNLGIANLDETHERLLTDINGELLAARKLATPRHFFYQNEEGTSLECWLLLPAEGRPPYPTIQYIHGGPHQGWGQIYVFDAQMLAGAGFAVLLVNYRGSTGYGDEFALAADGRQGPVEHGDLMIMMTTYKVHPDRASGDWMLAIGHDISKPTLQAFRAACAHPHVGLALRNHSPAPGFCRHFTACRAGARLGSCALLARPHPRPAHLRHGRLAQPLLSLSRRHH